MSYRDAPPPLRAAPSAPDREDGRRIAYVRDAWARQDAALRRRDRQIEEHARMLAGQQWLEWAPLLNEWVNLPEFQSDDERRRNIYPVVNLLLPWFLLTHTRLTESQPVLAFRAGPDAVDSELAEVLDTVFKTLWIELGMGDRWDEAAAWLVVGGRAYLQTRIDPTAGPLRPWVGRAELPVVDAAGQPLVGPDGQPLTQSQDQVPFDARGQPLMRVTPDGPQQLGEPHATPEGSLVVDVLSPLEVRGEWGPTPWHAKRYHLTRTYLSCDEVAARWGVEVAPTVRGAAGDQTTPYLRRLLFSAGHFGAANGDRRMWSGDDTMAGEDFVEVTSRWDRGAPGQPGRLCVVSPERVLSDGVVPYDLSYTSPIRAFDFVRLPGRVHGSTPLEQMVPLQRAINRGWKQILEHRDLSTNPIFLVDGQSGLQHQTLTLAPGDGYVVQTAPGVDPLRWVAPPPLSGDVWRTQQMLVQTLMKLGSLEGTEGDPPTPNASGELVKELRFNSDRPLSPPLRRAAEEFGRLAADWRAMLPTIWDVAKTIRYAGEDNIVRVLTVEPHLWEQGSVDVVADVDSMLPESQGERQARVYRMWQDGMLAPGLPPQSAAAINAYLSLARFPHLGRAVRPGGPDRTMAEQTLGALLAGTPSEALPWFPWYDEGVHLDVLTQYMKRPDFLKLDPAVQQQMAHRYETLQQLAQAKQAQAQALAQMMALAATPAAGGPGAGLPGGVGGLPPLPLGGMPEPPRPAFAGVGQP